MTYADRISVEQSDQDWRSNIDPQLLNDGHGQQCDNSNPAAIVADRQNEPTLRDLLVDTGDHRNTDTANQLKALEHLLPGISAYIAAGPIVEPTKGKRSPEPTNVLPGSSPHILAVERTRSRLESPAFISAVVDHTQRRAKTVRISSPGQNPRKLWEKKQRRDSVVQSIEQPYFQMAEQEEIKFEEATEDSVDTEKLRWETFVRESSGRGGPEQRRSGAGPSASIR